MNTCREAYIALCEGMVHSSRELLETAVARDGALIHMTGKRESREDYIGDILNGTLNYYDYEILSFEEEGDCACAKVRLLAKVYGGATMWWTLRMSATFVIEEEKRKIKECKVTL